MKILIVGRGWVGNKMKTELSNRGHGVLQCSHQSVADYLNRYDFDWVVNCAGVTGTPNVDACENDKLGTLEGNALFPIRLQQIVIPVYARLAHFSSGCIYSGEITDVNASPNYFGSIYSISKGISDSYLKDNSVVLRIRMPFTGELEQKNYLSKILNYARTGKLIDAGYNSLTDLDEAVRVACDMIEADIADGPYNLVNSGAITMHELVQMFDIEANWYTPEEFSHATVAGRSTCVIPAYPAMRPIKEALTDAIQKLLDKSTTIR